MPVSQKMYDSWSLQSDEICQSVQQCVSMTFYCLFFKLMFSGVQLAKMTSLVLGLILQKNGGVWFGLGFTKFIAVSVFTARQHSLLCRALY